MDDFWRRWAALEARRQWSVYRNTQPPEVETVDPDPSNGVFIVVFAGGEQFEVSPSCIAKPLQVRQGAG